MYLTYVLTQINRSLQWVSWKIFSLDTANVLSLKLFQLFNFKSQFCVIENELRFKISVKVISAFSVI